MRIIIIVFFLLSQSLYSQFRYDINSSPDSAAVYFNNELECYTPCRINYFWRQAENGKIVFSLKADGYQTWSDTIRSKPIDFDLSKRVYMEKKYASLHLEESPLIDFDKLMVKFDNGKVIGEKIAADGDITPFKWKGSIKVGDDYFKSQFLKTATNIGYNTQITEGSKLFSNDARREHKLPRYIVGVQIDDYHIQMRQEKEKRKYADGDMKVRTKMAFTWQVLDKKSGNIVYNYKNEKYLNNRQYAYQSTEYFTDVYELALIDFLNSEGLLNLLKTNEGSVSYSVDSLQPRPNLVLKTVELPKFNHLSEMISYANQSCVTIVTDGGHGSGAIVSEDGLLLSAYHVVEGVNQIDVKFSSGLTLQAEIIDYDKDNDIALLKVQGSGFRALPISADDEYQLGAEVITIGTPADVELGQSISKGILSGKRKKDDKVYWQVDMAVSPGNSGGPLMNQKGEIIGIIQSKIILEGVEGIGFALPIGKVKDVFKIQL